jgi:hypothetical protein
MVILSLNASPPSPHQGTTQWLFEYWWTVEKVIGDKEYKSKLDPKFKELARWVNPLNIR